VKAVSLFNLTEFLRLSAVLNYTLSARTLSRSSLLKYILGEGSLEAEGRSLPETEKIASEALDYLTGVYSEKRRQLGPLAVLHPLRAAALLARSPGPLRLLDLLTILFHDVLEDIIPLEYPNTRWREMESRFSGILEAVGPEEEPALQRRLVALTRVKKETYYEYVGRLLQEADATPELVAVKLADRLDNTMDMRIDLQDPLEGIDFFQCIFQLLFVNNYPGYLPQAEHPPSAGINGAQRLFQLFKNAVLLSMIRQRTSLQCSESADALFEAVAQASLKEAERTSMHLLGYTAAGQLMIAGRRRLLLIILAVKKKLVGQPFAGLVDAPEGLCRCQIAEVVRHFFTGQQRGLIETAAGGFGRAIIQIQGVVMAAFQQPVAVLIPLYPGILQALFDARPPRCQPALVAGQLPFPIHLAHQPHLAVGGGEEIGLFSIDLLSRLILGAGVRAQRQTILDSAV